jgi:DnaJ-class molecular chaperone
MIKPLLLLSLLLLLALSNTDTPDTPEPTLYELLEVDEKANSDEMKKAFRRLSIKYHPDRNAGNS